MFIKQFFYLIRDDEKLYVAMRVTVTVGCNTCSWKLIKMHPKFSEKKKVLLQKTKYFYGWSNKIPAFVDSSGKLGW